MHQTLSQILGAKCYEPNAMSQMLRAKYCPLAVLLATWETGLVSATNKCRVSDGGSCFPENVFNEFPAELQFTEIVSWRDRFEYFCCTKKV